VRAVAMLVRSVIGTKTPTPITVSPEPITLPLPATPGAGSDQSSKTDLELEPLGLRAGRAPTSPPPFVARLKAFLKAFAPRNP
jgi:hypothetical protein